MIVRELISMAIPMCETIVERNLEVAAQCCIDICDRIIALRQGRRARRPAHLDTQYSRTLYPMVFSSSLAMTYR